MTAQDDAELLALTAGDEWNAVEVFYRRQRGRGRRGEDALARVGCGCTSSSGDGRESGQLGIEFVERVMDVLLPDAVRQRGTDRVGELHECLPYRCQLCTVQLDAVP